MTLPAGVPGCGCRDAGATPAAGLPTQQTGTETCPFCCGVTPADAGIGLDETPLRSVFCAGAARRVVLDTNVLLALWVFADSRYAPLRRALDGGRWQALTSAACFDEFDRVLAYPQFNVAPAARQTVLDDYRRLADFVVVDAGSGTALPRCRDGDDQKFLELALAGAAEMLVTGDKALLVLARRRRLAHLFGIVTPDAALSLI